MQFCMAKDSVKLATRLVTASHSYLYSIIAIHCQFALYKPPGCSFAWNFAGLYAKIVPHAKLKVYTQRMHANCNSHAYAACKLSILHGRLFWQVGPILVAKTGPPNVIVLH